jgi:hypothetical protein
MSVKASTWVWHTMPRTFTINGALIRLTHRDLVVLLALADISDDDGRVSYGSAEDRTQPILAAKCSVSVKTFYTATKRLQGLGLLTLGYDRLVRTYRLELGITADSVYTVGKSDLLAESEDLTDRGESYRLHRSTVTDVKEDVLTFDDDLSDQFPKVTTEGSPQVPYLDWSAKRIQKRAAKTLDLDALADLVGVVLTSNDGIASSSLRAVLQAIAWRVLAIPAASGTPVPHPTSYVAAAIRNDPEVWRKTAFQLENTVA